MSRHTFIETNNDRKLEVTMGYDRPMDYYFMTIEDLKKQSKGPKLIYSNLNEKNAFQKDLELYKTVLIKHDIIVPNEMLEEVLLDGKVKAGNKMVVHHYTDGLYSQTVNYDGRFAG